MECFSLERNPTFLFLSLSLSLRVYSFSDSVYAFFLAAITSGLLHQLEQRRNIVLELRRRACIKTIRGMEVFDRFCNLF